MSDMTGKLEEITREIICRVQGETEAFLREKGANPETQTLVRVDRWGEHGLTMDVVLVPNEELDEVREVPVEFLMAIYPHRRIVVPMVGM
jgi:hypothetical protein